MRVATIGYASDHPKFEAIAFASERSVLDFDAVVWSPNGLVEEYRDAYTSVTSGATAPLLSVAASARLLQDMRRRRQEFARFLERGRTIVIDPPSPVCLRIHIIEDIVDFVPLEALPVRFGLRPPSNGAHVVFSGGQPFRAFAEQMPNSVRPCSVFDGFPGEPLFHAGARDTVAGGYVYHHPGHMLFLPLHSSPHLGRDEALIALFSKIGGGGLHLDLPDWASAYQVPGEQAAREKLRALTEEQELLARRIDAVREDLREAEHLKALIAGNGATLTTAVARAFQGFDTIVLPGLLSEDSIVVEDGERFLVVVVADDDSTEEAAGEADALRLSQRLEDRMARFRDTFFSEAKGVVVHAVGASQIAGDGDMAAAARLGAEGYAYLTGMDLMHLATAAPGQTPPLDRIFDETGRISDSAAPLSTLQ